MVIKFTVRKSEINPTINYQQVFVNGEMYPIVMDIDYYATDDEKELKKLNDEYAKDHSKPMAVPMEVYNRLHLAGDC